MRVWDSDAEAERLPGILFQHDYEAQEELVLVGWTNRENSQFRGSKVEKSIFQYSSKTNRGSGQRMLNGKIFCKLKG